MSEEIIAIEQPITEPELQTIFGTSQIEKPTAFILPGSKFIETDTDKIFIFTDEAQWIQQ